MGVNDGGKYVSKRKERQDMFVKYITRRKDVSDAPSDEGDDSNLFVTEKLRYAHSQQDFTQDGLHKVMDRRFGVHGPLVRFILLDTRSHRDNHYIRSLGEIKLPLTPLIAAFIRAMYSVLGLGRQHKGITSILVFSYDIARSDILR